MTADRASPDSMQAAHRRRARLAGRLGRNPLAMAVLLLASGCGPAGSSQDVARGKSVAISRAEFNQALARAPNGGAAASKIEQGQILEHLIDEKLLANAALAENLDHESGVLQQIESAKRSILANSFVEKLTANVSPPSNAEIEAFYAQHAEAFSGRVAADLDHVLFRGTPAAAHKFAALFDGGMPLDQVTALAAKDGVAVTSRSETLTSDKVPEAVGRQLLQMQPGGSFIYDMPDGALFGRLRQSRPAPVDIATARPIIRAGLINQKKVTLLKSELERLRAAQDVKVNAEAFGGKQPAQGK